MSSNTDTQLGLAPLLEGLRDRLAGSLALPTEAGYERAAPWNTSVVMAPAALICAADANDIAHTVRFAAKHNLRVAVQSTGHGAVPLSGDVLLVHTGRLQECTIDPVARTARIGAGVVAHQLIDAAAPHGLAPLVGSAPSVGVIGYLSGGGIGPFVSTFGLSAEYIRGLDVVTGDGQLRQVTAEKYPDLFWGLRGGKATLGIITSVEIDLLPLEQVYGGALYFDGADAPAVLHVWSAWSATLPEHATTSIAMIQLPATPGVPPQLAGRRAVAVRYASVADPQAAEAVLATVRAAAPTILDDVAVLPYREMGRIHNEPASPVPLYQDQTLLSALPGPAVDALVEVAGPASQSPLSLVELRRLGGALARTPRHPSAFGHRDAPFALTAIGVATPLQRDAVTAAVRHTLASLQPWSTGAAFVNFVDKDDPTWIARAYDPQTLRRLLALADRWDPTGVLATAGQLPR